MGRLPVINLEKTGKKIVELREKNGLSVKDVQKLMGLGVPQSIYRWQCGSCLPSIDSLVVLADIFKVRVDDILVVE